MKSPKLLKLSIKLFYKMYILNDLFKCRFKDNVQKVRQMCNGGRMSNVFVGGGQNQVFINGVR